MVRILQRKNPRKIPSRRHGIPIKFKNGAGFYKISLELEQSGKALTRAA